MASVSSPSRLQSLRSRFGGGGGDRKFGTFAGVFVPTILTILGAIMYLRLGWVVGNSGLVGAISIIILAHVITVTTGLAVSSMATNIRVGAGGAFSILSQSLGLEVGGSISVPLYLAQAISTTLYVFAFSEGWERIFPEHPPTLVVFITLLVVFIIAYTSARLASRVQFLILAIVAFSLVSVVLGSFPTAQQPGFVFTPVWIGDFPSGDYWVIFAVFFPAVTGIMAGINLSGALKDPRRSLPLGMMSAIVLGLVIYVLLAIWLAQVASPEELIDNTTVMVDKAYWSWAVLAGLLGATFSSALGSMLAAPRVLQALGKHRVLPYGSALAQVTADGEPRRAMLVTGVVALLSTIFGLLAGGLNAVAPLITMFFLITYFMLNAVVLIEQQLNMVSFRPTFSISRLVPLIGMLGCLFVMFLINPLFSLLAIVVALALYEYLVRRQLTAPWEDVRSGLFMALANWAVRRVSRLPDAPERTWRPNVLAPVSSSKALQGSYRFLWAIAAPRGSVHALGIYHPGDEARVANLEALARGFREDGIWSHTTLLEETNFIDGTRSAMEVLSTVFFRPNILFLRMPEEEENERFDLLELLRHTPEYHMGVILYVPHPLIGLGKEQVLNVWVREQGPEWELGLHLVNMDLALLLAYQLGTNWQARINLCMALPDQATKERARHFLHELIEVARLPHNTHVVLFQAPFWEALAQAPSADLSILGLHRTNPDLEFVAKVTDTVNASCIFVRDAGDESALA